VILGSPTSGGLSVYDKLNFGFNQLKGSSNIVLSLTNNIIHFNLNNVYTSSEADSIFATKTFLNTTIANLIGTAPENLNSLQELITSLGNDSNISSTIFTALSLKLSIADFNTTIANYTNTATLTANFYTQTQVNTLLNGYTTTSALTSILGNYYLKSEVDTTLSSYYGKSYIDTLISNYTTTSALTSLFGSYVLSTGLTTALSSYHNKSYIDTLVENYTTTSGLNKYQVKFICIDFKFVIIL